MKKKSKITSCPCGSGLVLEACCQRYLSGQAWPPTPEALMRSRYTAYVLHDDDYIMKTWADNETKPTVLFEKNDIRPKFVKLEVLETSINDEQTQGTVHFIAKARTSFGAQTLQELSLFQKDAQGHWLYMGPVPSDSEPE